MVSVPAHVILQRQRQQLQDQQQQQFQLPQGPMLQARLLWEENAGHPPMEWLLEAVSQGHNVDPGCLMEDPGMDHLLGTAWLSQS